MKIGLIRGRHPLPVEKCLIEQAEVPFDQAHRMAYDAMQKLLSEHAGDVDLYITGLKRATLGAVAGWINHYDRIEPAEYSSAAPESRTLRIWEYNAVTGQYESVIAFRSGAIMTEVLYCQGSYQFVWGTYALMEGT